MISLHVQFACLNFDASKIDLAMTLVLQCISYAKRTEKAKLSDKRHKTAFSLSISMFNLSKNKEKVLIIKMFHENDITLSSSSDMVHA